MDARTVLGVFVGGVLVVVALLVCYVVTEALDWGALGWIVLLLVQAGLAVLVMRAAQPGRRSGT